MGNQKRKWNCEFHPLGENGVVIKLGNQINLDIFQLVQTLSRYLEDHPFPGFIEQVPAFTSVTVYYDTYFYFQQGHSFPFEKVCKVITSMLDFIKDDGQAVSRNVEIPVCYGGEFGPDLLEVAEYNRLSPEEVIAIHSGGEYSVYTIGFAPGFPYLGGMSNEIASPRKNSPRLKIPAGSVGIAGTQTGIYPMETPGGWQLIGRTPIELFRPYEKIPSFLRAGDQIRFIPISPLEYELMKESD